jgi:hypothetical protein
VIARSDRGTTQRTTERMLAGSFEVWICSACGLTGWYAHGANETLALLAHMEDSGVAMIDGDPVTPQR